MSSDIPTPDELDELEELMERSGLPEDKIHREIRFASVNPDFYEDALERYQFLANQNRDKDPFFPYPDLSRGEFLIGTDPEERPVALTRRQLNEHMLIVGRSGAGKTTFFYNLMDTCQDRSLPFLVFDFKNDYRHLADEFELLVVNWRDFKFNPLQPPPGVRLEQWAEVVAETYAHATDMLIGSHSFFLERLRELYGLYSEEITEGVYPSLFELRDVIAAYEVPRSSPRFQYKERNLGRLNMMTGFSGDIFDCSRGYPVEKFLDRNVVLELQEPNQYVSNFAVESLLAWMFYYRDAMGQRRGLRHVVMFDEAKRVFSADREKQPEAGYPPVTELLGRVREFGEALIVADHEPSKLSDSLKANTNVKLWMALGSGKDVDEMAATFGLESGSDEMDFARSFDRGDGLLLSSEGTVPVVLPDYRVEKTTTETEVRESMENVLGELAFNERVRPDRFQDVVGVWEADTGEEEEDEDGLGKVVEAVLASVNEDPFLSMSDRYDMLDIARREGNAAKQELISLGLAREVEVRTGKPGRNPKMLELTKRGQSVLEERGYELVETGRRGIEHRYWQEQIKEFYEDQGFTVEIEHGVGQDRIDVYAESRQGERIAVEVARSLAHELENIEKCLEYGVDRVQVAYLEKDVKDKIEATVREVFGALPDELEFVPVSEFV